MEVNEEPIDENQQHEGDARQSLINEDQHPIGVEQQPEQCDREQNQDGEQVCWVLSMSPWHSFIRSLGNGRRHK